MSDLRTAIAAAIADPTDHNVGEVIKAMRKHPPSVKGVMNSLPKGHAAKISAIIATYWNKGIRL